MAGPTSWVPEFADNRLAEFRVNAGLTLTDLAKKAGIAGHGSIRDIELCKCPPFYRDGKVKPWVVEICKIIGKRIEDVFPFDFCGINEEEIVNEQFFGTVHRAQDSSVEDVIDCRNIIKMLYERNKNQAIVMSMRAHGYTFEEISQHLSLSVERLRQIEAKALRVLRFLLRDYWRFN